MQKYCKKIAAPQFHTWSSTALFSVALSGLTDVDRTGSSFFHLIWAQPDERFCLLIWKTSGVHTFSFASHCEYWKKVECALEFELSETFLILSLLEAPCRALFAQGSVSFYNDAGYELFSPVSAAL